MRPRRHPRKKPNAPNINHSIIKAFGSLKLEPDLPPERALPTNAP
jgi:hypothetical protein